MMGIFDALGCWIRWLSHSVGQTMLTVLEFVLTALISAVNIVVALLPADPAGDASAPSGMLGVINYFVPIGAIVGQFTLIMLAWIIYRFYQWLLRWAKAEG